MSLEAIEQVTETERQVRESRAAADARAQQLRADAEREGQELLNSSRAAAAEQGKALLQQAEARAAEKAAEIQRSAEAEAAALRAAAEQHLEEAAEFIVGRVVNH